MAWRLKPSIADLVRREMRKQDISLRTLARECRCDHGSLSRWLAGRRTVTVETAERVMARLGIKVTPPGK